MLEAVYYHVVYYMGLPLLILANILIFYFWRKEKHYLEILKQRDSDIDIPSSKRKDKRQLEKNKKNLNKLKTLQALFITFLILFLPLLNVTSYQYCDWDIHREMWGGVTIKGPAYATRDPVVHSIEPDFNSNEVINEMKSNPERWLPDDVEKHLDLEEISELPGWMAVYWMKNNRYIITYTYVSPVPVMKAYGFLINVTVDGDRSLIYMTEKTVVYPQSPTTLGKIF